MTTNDQQTTGRITDLLPVYLFASWPFVSFLSANLQETEYTQRILLIWAVFLAGCLLGHRVIRLVNREIPIARVSLFTGILAAWFFSFLPLSEVLGTWGIAFGRPHLLIWLGIAIVLAALTLWARPLRDFTYLSIAVAMGLLALPLYQIGSFYLMTMTSTDGRISTTVPASGDFKQRPNVYWILLDGYTRADLLKAQTGFDNQPFLTQLQSLGFRVGSESTSNYGSTKFSISTTMSMDYYLPLGVKLSPALWTGKLTGNNEVIKRFKSHGYTYIHVEPGSNNLKTRCGGAEDVCISGGHSKKTWLTESDIGLLKLTPLFRILKRLSFGILGISLIDPWEMFEKVRELKSEPFFVFGHILSPHTPNRFTNDCSRRNPIKWNVLDRYLNPDVVAGYVTDVKCINTEVITGIKQILETDTTNPIIIVQSDHGSPLFEPDSFENNLIRFANLSAIRFPPGCGQRYYPSVSSVNTFRMVFSCIEETPLPLLPDRYFLTFDVDEGLSEVSLKWPEGKLPPAR